MGNVDGRQAYVFSDAQLSSYSSEQVKVLEDVVQKKDPVASRAVAATIKKKIGYAGEINDNVQFLGDFYIAVAARIAQSPQSLPQMVAGDVRGMKRCPHCAEDIRVEAVKCRFCGSELSAAPMRPALQPARAAPVVQVRIQPSSGLVMRTIKGAIALMTFVILASVIGTCALCGKAAHDVVHRDENAREEVVNAAPENIVVVSSDKLQADYSANEVNADNLYRGKVLQVTGAVQAIRKGITDRPYVVLWTKNEFNGVHADFADDGRLGSVSAGQHITVKCIGDNVVLGSPMLKGCVLE